MIRSHRRHRRFCIATAFLILAAGPARAEPLPAPPPPPTGPVAMPYPNPEPLPPPPCTRTFCLPQPTAAQEAPPPPSPPSHKHLAGVKYEDLVAASPEPATVTLEADGSATQLDVRFVSWAKLSDSTTVNSADPMEGGQVTARTYQPGKPTYGNVKVEGTAESADPMEGGQIAAGADAKQQLDGTTVYSADPMEGGQIAARGATNSLEPGKADIASVQLVSEPVAKGTAIFKTLAGACTNGVHFKKGMITTRTGSFTLHDVTVTDVTPAGDGMDQVTLSYDSLGD